MRTLALLALVLSACETPMPLTDTGPGSDTPPGSDVPGVDAPPTSDAPERPDTPGPDTGPAADLLATPEGEWTHVVIPGAACGNGSPYGVAVNRSTTSQRVVVYLEGGGACWDNVTCNLIGTASNVRTGVSATAAVASARRLEGYLFSRGAVGPFAEATYVYMPYCTGDVHVGDVIQPYTGGEVHHVGHRNVTGVLAAVQAAFADTDRVWLTGASAGGYGALVAWYRFREAFPEARVDCLDDSGPPVDILPSRWNAMIGAWDVPEPTGCPECLESLSNVTAYYQRTATDGDRFALLQYTEDGTIRGYTGLNASQMSTAVNGLVPQFAMTTSHRIFVLSGADHVVLGGADRMSGGVSARDWVRAFATDGPGWDNVTP